MTILCHRVYFVKINGKKKKSCMKVNILAADSTDCRTTGMLRHWLEAEDFRHAASKGGKALPSLMARAALRLLLHRATGRHDWRLAADGAGKIHAFSSSDAAGPSVCLSHSQSFVAVALGPVDRQLGIDIERHRPRDFAALAKAAFGPAERDRVGQGGGAAFYRLWTLREAMGKATGQGLSLAADRRDHVPQGPDEGCWRAPGWFLGHLIPVPGYSLSLALRIPDPLRMPEIHLVSHRLADRPQSVNP